MKKLYSAILFLFLLAPALAQLSADWTFDRASGTYAPGAFGNLTLQISVLAPGDESIQDYRVSNLRTTVELPDGISGELRKESTVSIPAGGSVWMTHAFSIDPDLGEGSYPFRFIIYYDEQYTDSGNNACCQQVKLSNSRMLVVESPSRAPNYIRVVKSRSSGTVEPAPQTDNPVLISERNTYFEQAGVLEKEFLAAQAGLDACKAEVSAYTLANKVLTVVATAIAVIGGLIILGLALAVLSVLFLSFCALGLLLVVGTVAGLLVGLVLLVLLAKAVLWVFSWVKSHLFRPKNGSSKRSSRARRRARIRARRSR